jgi:hypothetical protein
LISRSARALRNTILGVGSAATVSSLAALDAVAKELTKAERRRRRQQREREDEREEEAEQRRAARRRRDNDDDDDDDRLELLRERHAALLDRAADGGRRVSARQSTQDDTAGEISGGGRTGERQTVSTDEGTGGDRSVIETAQVLNPTDRETDTDTDTGSETAEIRVGSGDTFASIDPETGTATAESNGVRAIAGPDGAFIEGSPSDTPSPAAPSDDLGTGDGNDDGLDPSPAGGDNTGEDLLS